MTKTFWLWTFVVDWVDGDTWHGIVDHGSRIYRGSESKPIRCRAALIQAPEMHWPDGPAAKAYASLIAPIGWYPCESLKPEDDGFGRPLLDIRLADGRMFSSAMVTDGYAKWYN